MLENLRKGLGNKMAFMQQWLILYFPSTKRMLVTLSTKVMFIMNYAHVDIMLKCIHKAVYTL